MENKYIFLLISLISLNFVSADLISIGSTGGDEILLGYGNQIDLFFSGIDTTSPTVTKYTPTSSKVTTTKTQIYLFSASDTNNITSCSLIFDGSSVATNNSINQSINHSFTYTHTDGTFQWSIECTDEYLNTGTTGNISIQFYTEYGGGSSSPYNYYSECYNITDGECKYNAFYDEPCPDNYFLTLDSCRESLILSEINQSTLDKLIEWANILTSNQTGEVKEETLEQIKEAIYKIPSDLNRYFSYFALKIVPSNELLGKCIIFFFLILLLLSNEIRKLIKKIKVKEKW